MPLSNDPYEQRLRRQFAQASRLLRKLYQDSIFELSLKASKITIDGQVFDLRKYPALSKQIDSVISRMHGGIYSLIVNGTSDAWDLSTEKNNRLIDRRLVGRSINSRTRRILYDPNKGALDSFIRRREKGLNLSERIWGALESHRYDLEKGLGLGISNGQSAADMAREQMKYLDDPDRLYRRVRDEYGKLKLSKAAKQFTPGPGKYRSSYKNAERLTRTETNTAYRKSDFDRWQSLPFVVGVEIRLSDAHPKYDICDNLAGRYPKWFNWTGWHPKCICYAVPIMMTDEEFSRLQDSQLGLGNFEGKSVNEVTDVPEAFNTYVQDKIDQINGWKSTPYWVQDNPEFIKSALLAKNPKPIVSDSTFSPAGEAIRPQFNKIKKEIYQSVKSALSAIDNVHGDGLLPNIPFTQLKERSYKAALAFNNKNEPIYIDLTSAGKGSEIHLVHEMGHLFDLSAIGEKGSFASLSKDSPLASVLSVASKSDAIRGIMKMLNDRTVFIDDFEYPLPKRTINYLNYLLDPREIWARAYAQFITKRSGNPYLIDGFQKLRQRTGDQGYKFQWDDNDFLPIEKEIEQMLLELGWINQSGG